VDGGATGDRNGRERRIHKKKKGGGERKRERGKGKRVSYIPRPASSDKLIEVVLWKQVIPRLGGPKHEGKFKRKKAERETLLLIDPKSPETARASLISNEMNRGGGEKKKKS